MDLKTKEKVHKSAKTDLFESPDFYALDDVLTDEHKLIRSSIRDFVKKEISPYIEQWCQDDAAGGKKVKVVHHQRQCDQPHGQTRERQTRKPATARPCQSDRKWSGRRD